MERRMSRTNHTTLVTESGVAVLGKGEEEATREAMFILEIIGAVKTIGLCLEERTKYLAAVRSFFIRCLV